MLLVQKLLNHPAFTLPAWQLEGCQTLLQFFICTQFRWFGAQAVVCVCVCLVSSVSLIAPLFTPFSASPYFLCFSSAICLSSAVFSLLLLFHLWFRSTFLLISFFFLLSSKDSPPPLASSSLSLSLCLSLSLRSSPASVSWLMVLTWKSELAVSPSRFRGDGVRRALREPARGLCCLVWFPPPGWEQLAQDMLITRQAASGGLHTLMHTHTHKDTHKIKLFSSNNDMSDSFKSGKTENSDCESIAEVLKYAAYSAGRCFYLNTRDFVRPVVSGLAKVN